MMTDEKFCSDVQPRMYLLQSDDRFCGFGTITSFSDEMTKSLATTPIPMAGPDCTIAIESGSGTSYNVEFTYSHGQEEQSLGTFCEKLMDLTSRWQAKSDGYRLIFNVRAVEHISAGGEDSIIVVHPTNPRFPAIYRQNVYIKSMSMTYAKGYATQVTGRLTLSVGGLSKMKDKSQASKGVYMANEYDIRV